MEVTGGSFREEVEDVLANDHHAIVLVRDQFTRDGQSREYRTAHVYDVRDGKLAKCWNSRKTCSCLTTPGAQLTPAQRNASLVSELPTANCLPKRVR